MRYESWRGKFQALKDNAARLVSNKGSNVSRLVFKNDRIPPAQDVEQVLRADGPDINREAKEAYLIDLYRQERISHRQLADALGFNRYETDGVLKRHKVSPNVTVVSNQQTVSIHRFSEPAVVGGQPGPRADL